MATPGFGLDQIAQIAVNVHDLERAVAFYRDRLGMRLLFHVPRMAFLDCAGIRLMLALPEKPEFDHPASLIYYKVADIAVAHATLVERGVVFETAPHLVARMPAYDLWMAFCHDSEGNPLALTSEVAPA